MHEQLRLLVVLVIKMLITSSKRQSARALVIIQSTNVNEYDMIYGEILNNLTN